MMKFFVTGFFFLFVIKPLEIESAKGLQEIEAEAVERRAEEEIEIIQDLAKEFADLIGQIKDKDIREEMSTLTEKVEAHYDPNVPFSATEYFQNVYSLRNTVKFVLEQQNEEEQKLKERELDKPESSKRPESSE